MKDGGQQWSQEEEDEGVASLPWGSGVLRVWVEYAHLGYHSNGALC